MLAVWNSLKVADNKGFRSIDFSPLSIEMLGFSTKYVAEAMLPAMKKYILEKKSNNLEEIYVCLETLPVEEENETEEEPISTDIEDIKEKLEKPSVTGLLVGSLEAPSTIAVLIICALIVIYVIYNTVKNKRFRW